MTIVKIHIVKPSNFTDIVILCLRIYFKTIKYNDFATKYDFIYIPKVSVSV